MNRNPAKTGQIVAFEATGKRVSPDFEVLDRQHRRAKHYRMYRGGKSLHDIAESTGYPMSQVSDDIRYVEAHGGPDESSLMNRGRIGAFVMAWGEYEYLKSEALGAWVRSQDPIITRRNRTVTRGEEVTVEETIEERSAVGDPRFLAQAETCLRQQTIMAGFVSDGQGGRAPVGGADDGDDENEVAIVEVGSRAEAAALEGVRYVRLGGAPTVDGSVVEVEDGSACESDPG